ncbi:MAG: class I SAM-dependent methyltransferase, partial [Gammaproteobacteria bacterium]|nr:class I SAM-dependent methyltransferase [Gammaproteobacteria bacterium]
AAGRRTQSAAMIQVAVYSPSAEFAPQARALATELNLPLMTEPGAGQWGACLMPTAAGLQVQPGGSEASGPIQVDFGSGGMRHRRRGGQNELLGRAVGVGKRADLSVVDATAGLGRDSFVLADLGCKVLMIERSPWVHALLRDGLQRAVASGDPWLEQVCSRLRLVRGDSAQCLRRSQADVVYLDPMFPERKKSARAKKEMWLFQGLLGDDADAEAVLELALEQASYRVVVKRPLRAPVLGQRSPGFCLSGRSVRFDVYTCA